MAADPQIALVTGANRGIGFECCRQLAERKLTIVATARDAAKADDAAARLAADGFTVTPLLLDLTDDTSIRAAADEVRSRFGRLDILVNNAGIFDARERGENASFFSVTPDVIRDSFEVNALGAFRVCRAFVPLMRDNGYGRIVNVSTGMAALTEMNGGHPGYRMSKVALNAITRILHDELQGSGIKVNSVCPGHVQTDMGGPDAPRAVEEALDTIIWLATLRDDGPSGGFFRDCKAIAW